MFSTWLSFANITFQLLIDLLNTRCDLNSFTSFKSIEEDLPSHRLHYRVMLRKSQSINFTEWLLRKGQFSKIGVASFFPNSSAVL